MKIKMEENSFIPSVILVIGYLRIYFHLPPYRQTQRRNKSHRKKLEDNIIEVAKELE